MDHIKRRIGIVCPEVLTGEWSADQLIEICEREKLYEELDLIKIYIEGEAEKFISSMGGELVKYFKANGYDEEADRLQKAILAGDMTLFNKN